jgi:tetratricopeptide (TPR) repeat protein
LAESRIASKETQVFENFAASETTDEVSQANEKLAADPKNPELWLEKGRALDKSCLFREAIDCYSKGLSFQPFHALLRRYRGHRYLNIRRFAEGAADLELASRVELANWDIWYHLGLAYFLLGEYGRAEEPYAKCLSATDRADIAMPAILDWSWMNKMRLGKTEEAKELLKIFDPDMDAGENQFYQNRVLVYAGLKDPETLMKNLDGSELDALGVSTQCYGLSNYYFLNGDIDKSNQVIKYILDKGYWPAFGYLAAETDARRRNIL